MVEDYGARRPPLWIVGQFGQRTRRNDKKHILVLAQEGRTASLGAPTWHTCLCESRPPHSLIHLRIGGPCIVPIKPSLLTKLSVVHAFVVHKYPELLSCALVKYTFSLMY